MATDISNKIDTFGVIMIIHCPNCGKTNYDTNKFCRECGFELAEPTIHCPTCNQIFTHGEKFCTNCGSELKVKKETELEIAQKELEFLEEQLSIAETKIKHISDENEMLEYKFLIKKLKNDEIPSAQIKVNFLTKKEEELNAKKQALHEEKQRKDKLFKKLYVELDDKFLPKLFNHFELNDHSNENNLRTLVNNYPEKDILNYITVIKTWDEFEEMNNTTESIYNLEDNKVLIILKDGTNLTDWQDVETDKFDDILYISEDLSGSSDLTEYYLGFPNLKAIIVNINGAKEMNNMFAECDSLITVSSPKPWDLTGIVKLDCLFSYCPSLVDISVLSNLDLSDITLLDGVFYNCTSLTDITPLASWDVSKVKYIEDLFGNCSSLTDITPISEWNFSNLIRMDSIFNGCSSLIDIAPIADWTFIKNESFTGMFSNCESLKDITPLSQFDLSNEIHG